MMHTGTCSVPHENLLARETRRAGYLQGLFIQDQASVCLHLDFITSSPPHPPSPFIWESTAKKTRFPEIASSLKVSQVFNSEKKWSCAGPAVPLVGDPVPQFTIHYICAITKTTNRERGRINPSTVSSPDQMAREFFWDLLIPGGMVGGGISLQFNKHRHWDQDLL